MELVRGWVEEECLDAPVNGKHTSHHPEHFTPDLASVGRRVHLLSESGVEVAPVNLNSFLVREFLPVSLALVLDS